MDCWKSYMTVRPQLQDMQDGELDGEETSDVNEVTYLELMTLALILNLNLTMSGSDWI